MSCFIYARIGGDFQVAYKILLVDDEKGIVNMMKDYFVPRVVVFGQVKKMWDTPATYPFDSVFS